jgi:hypothetical protein
MSKSKKARKVRNPIAVAMVARYGKQVTTHASGERRPNDRRAKDRDMQRGSESSE